MNNKILLSYFFLSCTLFCLNAKNTDTSESIPTPNKDIPYTPQGLRSKVKNTPRNPAPDHLKDESVEAESNEMEEKEKNYVVEMRPCNYINPCPRIASKYWITSEEDVRRTFESAHAKERRGTQDPLIYKDWTDEEVPEWEKRKTFKIKKNHLGEERCYLPNTPGSSPCEVCHFLKKILHSQVNNKLLMEGPFGTAKSYTAQTTIPLAAGIKEDHVILRTGSELTTSFIGSGPEKIAALKEQIEELAQSGPALLIIDEAEDAFSFSNLKEGSDSQRAYSATTKALRQLMTEWEKKQNCNLIIILNDSSRLDPGIKERLGSSIATMDKPNLEERKEILDCFFKEAGHDFGEAGIDWLTASMKVVLYENKEIYCIHMEDIKSLLIEPQVHQDTGNTIDLLEEGMKILEAEAMKSESAFALYLSKLELDDISLKKHMRQLLLAKYLTQFKKIALNKFAIKTNDWSIRELKKYSESVKDDRDQELQAEEPFCPPFLFSLFKMHEVHTILHEQSIATQSQETKQKELELQLQQAQLKSLNPGWATTLKNTAATIAHASLQAGTHVAIHLVAQKYGYSSPSDKK